MNTLLAFGLTAALALQSAPSDTAAPADAPTAPAIASLDELPIEQTTSARCGIAFAVVEGMQKAGHPGANELATLEGSGAREFFVLAMVRLMDETGLDREALEQIVGVEVQRHMAEEGRSALEMIPSCLLLLEASDA